MNAFASHCITHSGTGRPLAGYMIFNQDLLDPTSKSLRTQVNIATHELVHVLGFNKQLFGYFPEVGGLPVLDQSVPGKVYFRGAKLIAKMKEHLGCDQIDRVPLEDEGGEQTKGNHFEFQLFGNEIMVGSSQDTYRFSKFTLAFLEDTGW